jgi:hypothetical protein
MNEQPRRSSPRQSVILAVAVLVITVVPAIYVVVRNATRISTGPVPNALKPVAADTTMRALKNSIGSKLRRLEARFDRARRALTAPTQAQESLASLAAISLAATREALAALDTCTTRRTREVVADSVRTRYAAAKEAVRAYGASHGRTELDSDSLDEELHKAIGD